MSIKTIISLIIGTPAAVVLVSELNDLSMWWVQAMALGAIMVVLAWNGAFTKRNLERI
ncbi:hypothetical protein J6S35_00640 [Candidatus Saccharibacteria bacterium]|nr:hypothetical protein [Candidatus Saccharibacteria bacterium]